MTKSFDNKDPTKGRMSVQFQNNQQQEVHLQEDVEANGHAQREFNRMTSTEERAERTRVRRIFESVGWFILEENKYFEISFYSLLV